MIEIKQGGRINGETINALRRSDDSWKYMCGVWAYMVASFEPSVYRRKKKTKCFWNVMILSKNT